MSPSILSTSKGRDLTVWTVCFSVWSHHINLFSFKPQEFPIFQFVLLPLLLHPYLWEVSNFRYMWFKTTRSPSSLFKAEQAQFPLPFLACPLPSFIHSANAPPALGKSKTGWAVPDTVPKPLNRVLLRWNSQLHSFQTKCVYLCFKGTLLCPWVLKEDPPDLNCRAIFYSQSAIS